MYQSIFITNRTQFTPSMVHIWDDEKGHIVHPYKKFDYAYKLDPNGSYETIYGDKVKQVFRWSEGERGIFESDVPRETRVLTDLYLQSDDVAKNHRLMIFDIEVDSTNGFAKPENADKEITAIGCYTDADGSYTVCILDKEKTIPFETQTTDKTTIARFDTERELLETFMAYYQDYAPTILSGWNSNSYDIPYLYNRLLNVFGPDVANFLSPIGIVRYSTRREYYQIAGVNCLDYLELYKKFTYTRRPNYRLDTIGRLEVGMGKIEYEGTLDDLRRNDLAKFIEYNLRDVHIVEAIDKKMRLIDLVKSISHTGHTTYEDFSYSSKYIEGTIITYLHRQNKVASNKSATGAEEFQHKLDDDEEGFKGAYVKAPIPGLYNWVYNLDLQSLYPSIIMSLNISPETKIGKVLNWNMEQHMEGTADQYIVQISNERNVLTRAQFDAFMKTQQCMISSNGILYRGDRMGVIPEILDKWFADRVAFKNKMKEYKKAGDNAQAAYYDQRQLVQKILLNSIYGVLGLPIFRFYDLDNALAVTASGQDIIKTTAKIVNAQYNKTYGDDKDRCIYIDTDSVYFAAESVNVMDFIDGAEVDSVITEARHIESLLNEKFYPIMARQLFYCTKHRFVIKGEAISKTAFWVAKKRYAMDKVFDLESNIPINKMSVTGLDTVRSSFPPAFGNIMKELLTDILAKVPRDIIDAKILQFREDINTMKFEDVARNTSVKDIAKYDDTYEVSYIKFPKGCSAHVKAAIAYNRWLRNHKLDKIYEPIRNGDKIKYTYLVHNALSLETMALRGDNDPPELVDFVQRHIDYNALFEKELLNKLDDFYSALKWGNTPTEINQTASEFFEF